ncbi:ATP-binding protein [Streptomyces sp. NBC_00250]|uniref:ATP-binding protein n=1 Tax=Streptomyces sp. NBC_00250 TaxID=2903641 RepID=UPI002E29703A|nr:ATP-binding protein [Streptomyces sp. NBC_00250]
MSTAAVQLQPRSTSVDADQRPELSLTIDHVAGISALRRRVVETLEALGCTEDLVDTAALLATELLSNGLTHADTGSAPRAVRLDMYWSGYDLTIAVTDADPRPPVARTSDGDEEHGRGLALVDALATCWGSIPLPNGKTVWCLLR